MRTHEPPASCAWRRARLRVGVGKAVRSSRCAGVAHAGRVGLALGQRGGGKLRLGQRLATARCGLRRAAGAAASWAAASFALGRPPAPAARASTRSAEGVHRSGARLGDGLLGRGALALARPRARAARRPASLRRGRPRRGPRRRRPAAAASSWLERQALGLGLAQRLLGLRRGLAQRAGPVASCAAPWRTRSVLQAASAGEHAFLVLDRRGAQASPCRSATRRIRQRVANRTPGRAARMARRAPSSSVVAHRPRRPAALRTARGGLVREGQLVDERRARGRQRPPRAQGRRASAQPVASSRGTSDHLALPRRAPPAPAPLRVRPRGVVHQQRRHVGAQQRAPRAPRSPPRRARRARAERGSRPGRRACSISQARAGPDGCARALDLLEALDLAMPARVAASRASSSAPRAVSRAPATPRPRAARAAASASYERRRAPARPAAAASRERHGLPLARARAAAPAPCRDPRSSFTCARPLVSASCVSRQLARAPARCVTLAGALRALQLRRPRARASERFWRRSRTARRPGAPRSRRRCSRSRCTSASCSTACARSASACGALRSLVRLQRHCAARPRSSGRHGASRAAPASHASKRSTAGEARRCRRASSPASTLSRRIFSCSSSAARLGLGDGGAAAPPTPASSARSRAQRVVPPAAQRAQVVHCEGQAQIRQLVGQPLVGAGRASPCAPAAPAAAPPRPPRRGARARCCVHGRSSLRSLFALRCLCFEHAGGLLDERAAVLGLRLQDGVQAALR